MKVRYTARAIRDLNDISVYLRSRNPAAADAVVSAIEMRISRLPDFPWTGPATDEAATRELSIKRYPYKVYYQVEDEDIWILHIRHTSRRQWQDRD